MPWIILRGENQWFYNLGYLHIPWIILWDENQWFYNLGCLDALQSLEGRLQMNVAMESKWNVEYVGYI